MQRRNCGISGVNFCVVCTDDWICYDLHGFYRRRYTDACCVEKAAPAVSGGRNSACGAYKREHCESGEEADRLGGFLFIRFCIYFMLGAVRGGIQAAFFQIYKDYESYSGRTSCILRAVTVLIKRSRQAHADFDFPSVIRLPNSVNIQELEASEAVRNRALRHAALSC